MIYIQYCVWTPTCFFLWRSWKYRENSICCLVCLFFILIYFKFSYSYSQNRTVASLQSGGDFEFQNHDLSCVALWSKNSTTWRFQRDPPATMVLVLVKYAYRQIWKILKFSVLVMKEHIFAQDSVLTAVSLNIWFLNSFTFLVHV